MKKQKNRAARIVLGVLAAVLLTAAGYVAYVFIDYHRIDDRQTVTPVHAAQQAQVQPGDTYTALTYNIGFGAYTPDYDFFMDGGTQSWARSKESAIDTVNGAGTAAAAAQADFVLFQEVDVDATRTYHVDEKAIVDSLLPEYDSAFAINYDSPFLFFPITQPHGKSRSGIGVYSRFPITDALRRQLPIDTGFGKLLDLDRAYVVTHIPMSDGRQLALYTIHMTAYTSDSTIRDAQLAMLIADMTAEYAAGNAAVCGGDFNMEMLLTERREHMAEWALPLSRENLGVCVNAWDAQPYDAAQSHPWSCRDAGKPYTPGENEEWMVDSFIVTPNVTVEAMEVVDLGYRWSDHNPVRMTFHID